MWANLKMNNYPGEPVPVGELDAGVYMVTVESQGTVQSAVFFKQ